MTKLDNNRDYMTLQYDFIRGDTDKAVLLEIEGDEYWLPKSQIEIDEEEQNRTSNMACCGEGDLLK